MSIDAHDKQHMPHSIVLKVYKKTNRKKIRKSLQCDFNTILTLMDEQTGGFGLYAIAMCPSV